MNLKLDCLIVSLAAGLMLATGCTTPTRVIVPGENIEGTAALSEADQRYIVSKAIQDIDRASIRYEKPGARRVINIKPFVIDTTSRGSSVGYLADSLRGYFEEELMNGGKFIVYNESFVSQTGVAAVRPEFVMTGTLREQNVRRDNGDFYKETILLLKLTDAATGMDFWQKRVPLQKAVDKKNILN